MDVLEKEIATEEKKIKAIRKRIKALRSTMLSKQEKVKELKLELQRKMSSKKD